MSVSVDKLKYLYHFTCLRNLAEIKKSGYLKTTTSNLDFNDFGKCPVVWLTSSPAPENNGLLFADNIPDDLNKTHIRITVRWKKYFKHWDSWSDEKGMDKNFKQALINSASAENTYMKWYISEKIIPFKDVLAVENISTGQIYYRRDEIESK